MSTELYPHIVADPAILAGLPVIEGTQVPVSTLIAQVATGKRIEDVARDHGVTVADVRSALEYAALLTGNGVREDAIESSPVASLPQVDPAEVEAEARRVGLDPAQLSPLGRRLLEIRVQAAAAGEQFLGTWEELDAETAERRGGYHYPDEDE